MFDSRRPGNGIVSYGVAAPVHYGINIQACTLHS